MRWLRTMKADLDLHGSQPNLTTALRNAAELMAPVASDNHWIRALPHIGNSYAGNYLVYPFCDEKGEKKARWFRRNSYSPLLGKVHRSILKLGGRPGANEQILAFADAASTATVGGTALGTASSHEHGLGF